MMGLVWVHHCRVYQRKFNERTPQWLDTFRIYDRLQVVKLACKLNWRLPSDVIAEEAIDITDIKRPQRK